MITSKGGSDPNAIALPGTYVIGDPLQYSSAIRPTYLFACSESSIRNKIGICDQPLLKQVSETVKSVLP